MSLAEIEIQQDSEGDGLQPEEREHLDSNIVDQRQEELKVNEIKLEVPEEPVLESAEPAKSDRSAQNKCCRICFEEELEKDDPLLSPCKCSGSMEYVHLKCLQQWRSRTENKKQTQYVTTYTWKAFHCDICKEKLEDSYESNGKTFQIFEVEKPARNYIIIETSQVNTNEN